ncbi:MAG TPA: DMT family transporter [Streptosporangiaceae bacterium]|nr:DMT family transporter [Streptosporangiaceae bacterium]
MSATAITLILIAAVAHASWNLFSKQAAQTGAISFIWLAATAGTILYIPVIAVAWAGGWLHLTALGWVFMAGTGVLESAYFVFLQSGYRLGDLSLVYPVGRGTGALLAAVAGIVFLGERPGPVAIGGIIAIVAGIALIGAPSPASAEPPAEPASERNAAALFSRRATRRDEGAPRSEEGKAARIAALRSPASTAIGFAIATGVFIASYTLWDRYAVATLGTSALLQGYATFPFMAVVFALPARRAADRTALVWHRYRAQVAGAAVLMPLAYILVLAALAFTAVSVVAPAREVSVLLGVLMGGRLLGEGSVARRLTAAVAIAGGIIAIAVG